MNIICERQKVAIAKLHIKEAIEELLSWYGIKLTQREFLTFLRKHYDVAKEVASGVNTETREIMAEALAKDLINKRWPSYGDGKKCYEVFIKKFDTAFQRKYHRA